MGNGHEIKLASAGIWQSGITQDHFSNPTGISRKFGFTPWQRFFECH